MCFTLYIASDKPIPAIAWDDQDRKLYTRMLDDYDRPVAQVFSKTDIKYVGSDLHCGCGFRKVSFQGGGWPEANMIDTDPDWETNWGADEQNNYLQLFDFVSGLLAHSTPIELYGVWYGDFHFPPARHESISVEQLQSSEFFFRERCKYLVTV